MSPARILLDAVRGLLDDQYPFWVINPQALPAGLRLELHPWAYYMMLRDPDFGWQDMGGGTCEQHLAGKFGIPVKVTADLPDGTWRLVIVTEDVLLGGKMPERQ